MMIAFVDVARTATIVGVMMIVFMEIGNIDPVGSVLVIATMMIADAVDAVSLVHATTTLFEHSPSRLLSSSSSSSSSSFRRSNSINRDSLEDMFQLNRIFDKECSL
jgi:hypothetical protein